MNQNSSLLRQVDATGRQIREIQMERAAIPPMRRLSDLVAMLQEHAGLSAQVLNGSAKGEPRRAALKEDIARIQSRTRPTADGWQHLATDWGYLALAVDLRALPAAECADWHASLIRHYKTFIHEMEALDGRLARRVEDLRLQQRRNLGGMSVSTELLCG
jgi:hypothetical protein